MILALWRLGAGLGSGLGLGLGLRIRLGLGPGVDLGLMRLEGALTLALGSLHHKAKVKEAG